MPPGAPRGQRRPPRRAWLIGAGVVAVVAIVVVIALVAGGGDDDSGTTSGTAGSATARGSVDEPHPCAQLDGILDASDVESIFGVTISTVEGSGGNCDFAGADGKSVLVILDRGKAEDYAGIRNGELFASTAEDVSGVGDEAFYGGDENVAGPVFFAKQGDDLVSTAWSGGVEETTREKLIDATELMVQRLSGD